MSYDQVKPSEDYQRANRLAFPLQAQARTTNQDKKNAGSDVKPVRRLLHALKHLVDRETERAQADRTLAAPERIVAGQIGRKLYTCRYFDTHLRQEVPRRLILEDTIEETVVGTTREIQCAVGE